MTPGQRLLATIALPPLFIGGFVVAGYMPRPIASFYDGWLGPFLIMYWIGLQVTNGWYMFRIQLAELKIGSRGLAIVGGVIVLLLIIADPLMFWHDPWLFGVFVVPAFELIVPYLHERATRLEEDKEDRTEHR